MLPRQSAAFVIEILRGEPVRYLLDTSAVIDLTSSAQITADDGYLISSITLAELNAGIHAAKDPLNELTSCARLQ